MPQCLIYISGHMWACETDDKCKLTSLKGDKTALGQNITATIIGNVVFCYFAFCIMCVMKELSLSCTDVVSWTS